VLVQLPFKPRLFEYESTDSTNERAFAAIADGSASHGDVHIAEHQTAGRGRLGRQWQADEGEGLLFSVVLFPPVNGPKPTELTVATCLALYDMACEFEVPGIRLKWPNDLLSGDSKLCGILLETRGLDEAKPHFVVGVGLNVLQREFPREVTEERSVTSLALQGVRASRKIVFDIIWKKLDNRLRQDAAELFADYTTALALDGEVVLRTSKSEVRGQLVAVESRAGVRIRMGDGQVVETPLEFVRSLSQSARGSC